MQDIWNKAGKWCKHRLVWFIYFWFVVQCTVYCGCVDEGDLLAENKGKVVFSLLLVSQVFEAQPLQEADQTLIIYGELCPWQRNKDHTQDIVIIGLSWEYVQLKACFEPILSDAQLLKISSWFHILGVLSSLACASSRVFSMPSVRSLCLPMTV